MGWRLRSGGLWGCMLFMRSVFCGHIVVLGVAKVVCGTHLLGMSVGDCFG
jgi:hypothetical protein